MQYTTLNELRLLEKINETNVSKITQTLNQNFEKGLISEELCENSFKELDSLIEKAGNHKYFKREGTVGNYKYYYTEEEYKKVKGGEGFKIGDKVKLDDDGKVREYTITKPGMRASNERLVEGDVYLTAPGTIGFDASVDWVKKNMIKDKAPSSETAQTKSQVEPSVKVGDKIKGSEGVTKDKVGTITSISGDMAQVDFGGGDKYGVTLRRIKEGEFTVQSSQSKDSKDNKEPETKKDNIDAIIDKFESRFGKLDS